MRFYCLGSLPRASGRHRAGNLGQGGAAGTHNAPSVPVPELAGVQCLLTAPEVYSLSLPSGPSEGRGCLPTKKALLQPQPLAPQHLVCGLRVYQHLAPLLPLPQPLLIESPQPLPSSQNLPALAPFSTARSFPSFGNFSPAAHTVRFLGPIPAGFGGVCCFLGHHRESWKLGDVGQDCGGRV